MACMFTVFNAQSVCFVWERRPRRDRRGEAPLPHGCLWSSRRRSWFRSW